MKSATTILINIFLIFLLHFQMGFSDPDQGLLLRCLSDHSTPNPPISPVVFFPENPRYSSVLQSYIRNLRFATPSTSKPLFIVTPVHVSHVQASIVCARIHGLELRIRSGGHDYDGLSYISAAPFIILDLFNLRSMNVDLEDESVWVESGATLGELFYRVAENSKIHGFPAGVCPTVGVGGHFSGGGYGNMMRKFGLSTDNLIDATIVVADGRVLDRKSMGEDLFWAIRGGGGASFGVILSWKIKLVPVPETVTVFRVERTLEQGATDIVHQWQIVAPKIDQDLFIRVVLLPVTRKNVRTIKAKFVGLFLGNAKELLGLIDSEFPELGLSKTDCTEMSWIESVLFWDNHPKGSSMEIMLDRQPKPEKFLKKKSDYVIHPISKTDLEGIWKKMIELRKPAMALNPYGGKMSEISEFETPFPHRSSKIYKIQYSVTWKEENDEAENTNLGLIRSLYDYMTPYVSKSPRSAYLNYRDVDLGINEIGNTSYSQAQIWGEKYFNQNFDRLVQVKTMIDPANFFRYEQSIPAIAAWESRTAE